MFNLHGRVQVEGDYYYRDITGMRKWECGMRPLAYRGHRACTPAGSRKKFGRSLILACDVHIEKEGVSKSIEYLNFRQFRHFQI
jgi:hypothetical protein